MRLTAAHLTKTIRKKEILKDVSLEMESGMIYGIVGRNGSGKTMLLRALSGLMTPDSGTVELDGRVLHKDFGILPGLGIILENAGLYPELTGMENLRYLAGIRKEAAEEDIRQAILRVGLDPKDRRTVRKYSLGMRQRIVLAQAIMEKPDILFLDEPTGGLDENGVQEIRQVIREEKERGAIVLLVSHNRDDIGMLADEVYRMQDGQLTRQPDDGMKGGNGR